MSSELLSFLRLRSKCPVSRTLDLTGWEDCIVDDEAVTSILPHVGQGSLRTLLLSTNRLPESSFARILDGIQGGLVHLSLAFLSTEKTAAGSAAFFSAVERLLERSRDLEQLELVFESMHASTIRAISKLHLESCSIVTQFDEETIAALSGLPTTLKSLWLGTCILGPQPTLRAGLVTVLLFRLCLF